MKIDCFSERQCSWFTSWRGCGATAASAAESLDFRRERRRAYLEGLGAVEVESMGRAESSDGEKCERKLLAVQYSMVSLEGGEGVSTYGEGDGGERGGGWKGWEVSGGGGYYQKGLTGMGCSQPKDWASLVLVTFVVE